LDQRAEIPRISLHDGLKILFHPPNWWDSGGGGLTDEVNRDCVDNFNSWPFVMAEPKYNSGGVEADRTEMTREDDVRVSEMRETADDALPFTVDE
jgi:hypothetical protein